MQNVCKHKLPVRGRSAVEVQEAVIIIIISLIRTYAA